MFIPLGGVSLCSWETLPRLNADKSHRFRRCTPKQRIRIFRNIADDFSLRILFIYSNRFGTESGETETIIIKQRIRQWNRLRIFPLIKTFSREQTMRKTIQNDWAFLLLKPNLIIRSCVVFIKRNIKSRMKANSTPHILVTAVFHMDFMVERMPIKSENTCEFKIKRKSQSFRFFVCSEHQLSRNSVILL